MGDNPLKTAEARHDLLIDYWGMGLTPEVTHRYMAKLFRQQAEKKADQGPSKKDKKKKKKGSQDKKDPNTEDSISLGFIDHLFKRFENEGEEGRKFREKDRKQYFMRVRRGKNDLIDNYLSVIKYPVYNMSLHIDLDRLDIVVQCFNNKEKIVLAYKRLYGDTLFNVFYGNNDLFVSELLPGGDNFFKVIAKHIYVIMKYLDEPLDYLTIGMPIDLRLSKHSFFSEAVAIWPPIFRLRVKEFLIQVPANSGHYSNMVKFMEFLNREDLTSTQIRSKSEEYRANFMSALNDSESVSAAYKDEQEMRKRGKEEEKRVEVLEVRIGRVTTQHFDKLAPDFNFFPIHVEHPYKDTKISVTEPFELETIQELLYKKWDKVETKVQVKGHIYVFVVTISPWEEETFKVILKFKSKVLNVKVMLGDVVDDGTIWDWVHETEKAETVEKEVQTEKEVKKEEGGDQLANRLEEQSVAGPSTSQVVQPARPLVAGPRVAGSSGPSDAGPSTSQCPEAEPPVENPKADGKKNKRNSSSFFGRKCDQFRNLLK